MLMPSIFGENLFDDFFNEFARPARSVRYSTPNAAMMRTDIKENENSYELSIELPGYKKEDVNAELKDGYMTITATTCKDNEQKDESGKYVRRERYSGSCSRSFFVGEEVEQTDIKAKFEDGILKVTVPKVQPKPQVEEKKMIAIEG
ncbi:MAG: Hsp20/alpha crystallin family protein [Eubacterium sp.]|nr:Hsp20/alpha crystallin family protein [Eubacterium sp.]